MVRAVPLSIPVIDFRRQSMVLQWETVGGTWTACDLPPALVHGIALIRADQPHICLYGRDGRLHLHIGDRQYEMTATAPRVRWIRGAASLGLRRHLIVEAADGDELLRHTYWADQGDIFFSWLNARAGDAAWRAEAARTWSEGLEPAALRSS